MTTSRYQRLDRGVWDHQTRTTVLPGTSGWAIYQNWLTAGGVLLPLDAVGQMTLAEAKAARIAEIDAYAASLRNQIVSGRSAGEMASWAIKLTEALARSASQPSPFAALMPGVQAALGLPTQPAGVLHAMALARGITEAEYAGKVLADATLFFAAEIAIDAARGAHRDAILALSDVRDVVTYDWSTGWPAIPGAPAPN